MKYLSFILFSSFEYYAILLLGFSLFRFKRFRLKAIDQTRMIGISVILSFVSLLIKLYIPVLDKYSPFILLLTMFLLLVFVYNMSFNSALFKVAISYFAYGMVQAILVLIISVFADVKLSYFQNIAFNPVGWAIQFSTFTVCLYIDYLIKARNEGFEFSPDSPTLFKLRYSNKVFITIIAISLLIVGILYARYEQTLYIPLFIAVLLALTTSTVSLLYVSIKRDKEQL